MEPSTHYTTLSLIPSAPLPVIKAAYKALVLIHHPDKTIHLSASERAHHSATFRLVQEAYDVLTNASTKASYDAELSRHGNRVDLQRSTFHRASSSYSSRAPASASASATPTPTPNPTRKPTTKYFCNTPEEQITVRKQCEASLASMRTQRKTRDTADAAMNDVGLRYTLKCWKDIAAQREVKDSPLDAAFVQVMIHEYSLKVVEREEQDKEWLKNMATPKKGSQPQAQSQSQSQSQAKRTTSPSTNTGTTTSAQTTKAKQRAEERRKAQETKAAAVRAEKEKMLQKAAVEARKRAEQIARARAKAAPAPVRPRKDVPKDTDEGLGTDAEAPKPGAVRKPCGVCGKGHASLAEWIKCNVQAHKENSTNEDPATAV